jgi:hypothetical protein
MRKQSPPALLTGLLCAILLVLSFTSAEAQNNFTITNYFSEKYRDFPMSKISIIPPAGFVKDTAEFGFISRSNNSSIRVIDMKKNVDTVFESFIHGVDSTGRSGKYKLGIINTETGPIEVLEIYDFKINGFSSHLVKLFEYTEGEKYFVWTLFTGDTATTYMINGFLPKRKQNELEQPIRNALLSVFYEPNRRILPIGADATSTSVSACGCHDK